jgi:FkbM family methyltransferase
MPHLDRRSLATATVRGLARRIPYVESELRGLSELIEPGDVCVDVGSAAGLYTLTLSQLAGPGGQVHSVEPLPFAHTVWSRVLRARAGTNVRPYALALGAEPGIGTMSVPMGRYQPVSSRSFLAWKTDGVGSNAEFRGQIEVMVEVDTLDGLCARNSLTGLDFVKIDVEGGELDVLRGGEHAVESFRPTLLVEIEARHITRYQHSPDDVVNWLTQRGYAMYTWREGWQPDTVLCAHVNNYLFRPA